MFGSGKFITVSFVNVSARTPVAQTEPGLKRTTQELSREELDVGLLKRGLVPNSNKLTVHTVFDRKPLGCLGLERASRFHDWLTAG